MTEPSEEMRRNAYRVFFVVAEMSGPERRAVPKKELIDRINELGILDWPQDRVERYVQSVRTKFLLAKDDDAAGD